MTSPGTIVVGLSGGVDSSVAAALLLEQGWKVIGVTMKTYDFEEQAAREQPDSSCCGLGAVHDARTVASTLGIPHYVADFRGDFEEKVIGPFIGEYMRGRTPNPCILCNRDIKWGSLLRKADALGVTHIATGHYARLRLDESAGGYVLSRAIHAAKDQSYALWALPQEALARTLFPLGSLTKPDVRAIARRWNLRTAEKEESADICFVENNDYGAFIRSRMGKSLDGIGEGDVILDGQAVGRHQGYPFYTIGQRKGIGSYGRKMYVTALDASQNQVHIGDLDALHRRSLIATGVRWHRGRNPNGPARVEAKVRYADEASPATVTPGSAGQVRVDFDGPKRAITPGQSIVFYNGDDVLGGAVIDSVLA